MQCSADYQNKLTQTGNKILFFINTKPPVTQREKNPKRKLNTAPKTVQVITDLIILDLRSVVGQ